MTLRWLLLTLCLCLTTAIVQAQNVNVTWTLIYGSQTHNQTAAFEGTVRAPGARDGAVGWYDESAKELWLFGGFGFDEDEAELLNDLWMYSVNDNTWTWISGNKTVRATGIYDGVLQMPGSRYDAVAWYISSTKEVWLFGGLGYAKKDYGTMNDLWKFSVDNRTWVFVKGTSDRDHVGEYGNQGDTRPENVPRARRGAVSWYVKNTNELYLFGGHHKDGYLNDLWRYGIEHNTWTWISGSNGYNNSGSYGNLAVPHPSNTPPSRANAVGWYDSSSNQLWLFGGERTTSTRTFPKFNLHNHNSYSVSVIHVYNDLWKYDISSGNWTWMSGSNQTNMSGIYGTMGVPNNLNVPGARYASLAWFKNSSELWLFGGRGIDALDQFGYLNDVWKYSVNDNLWTWITGNLSVGTPGVYSSNGNPGARWKPVGMYDESEDELWLATGFGVYGYQNDVWKGKFVEVICPSNTISTPNGCEQVLSCSAKNYCHLGCDSILCYVQNGLVVDAIDVIVVNDIIVNGNATFTGNSTVTLHIDSSLKTSNCIILEDGSNIIVVVDNVTTAVNGTVLVSYSTECPQIIHKVDMYASVDECKYGTPKLTPTEDNGIARLELLFLPTNDPCGDGENQQSETSNSNVIAIAIGVTSAVVVVAIAFILVALFVPAVRKKIFPFKRDT